VVYTIELGWKGGVSAYFLEPSISVGVRSNLRRKFQRQEGQVAGSGKCEVARPTTWRCNDIEVRSWNKHPGVGLEFISDNSVDSQIWDVEITIVWTSYDGVRMGAFLSLHVHALARMHDVGHRRAKSSSGLNRVDDDISPDVVGTEQEAA